jgi:hypothetical protein
MLENVRCQVQVKLAQVGQRLLPSHARGNATYRLHPHSESLRYQITMVKRWPTNTTHRSLPFEEELRELLRDIITDSGFEH